VAEPQLLGGQRLAANPRNRDSRWHGRSNDSYATSPHLDVSSRQLWIPHLGRARHHLTLDEHDALGAEGSCELHCLRWGVARIERDLNQASPVSQVDEHELAEIAFSMDPPAEVHLGSHVGGTQSAARMTPNGCRER
jgi:hypothetical protein